MDGSINIPVDELRERLGELDRNKTIVEYCRVGLRGYIADRILSQNGYKVLNVTGGYLTSSILDFNPKKPEAVKAGKVESSEDLTIDPETQAVIKG